MTFWFVVAVLGVWRATHLLAAEDGPFDLIARLREWAGRGFAGRLLDCFNCLSLWVAAPFALETASRWEERVLSWLALSGAAILLERLTTVRSAPVATAAYVEGASPGEETEDGLLRK
jgi:hypothetical protein